jgi:hypothetical protein
MARLSKILIPSVTSINEKVFELYQKGFYSRALEGAEKILIGAEQTYGTMHQSLVPYVSNLAVLFDLQAKFAEAETLFDKAMKIIKILKERDLYT